MIIQETTKMSEREKMAARNSNFCYLLNALYPVGSIYVSKDPTDPAEIFGGSWKRIKERFIWAIGDNENPGDTGGEKTHTLSVDEMPSHNHSPSDVNAEGNWVPATSSLSRNRYNTDSAGTKYIPSGDSLSDWKWGKTSSVGGSQPHNNMPPWEGFYIWERIESDVPMGGSAGMLLADQTYNPESANAQSGIAVAQAVDTCSPAIVTTSDTGKALSIPDSSESVIRGLTAYGESTQDGTPTPDSPVEIINVENPVINIGNQTVTVPYTFRGLKNTSGDWVARDELRVEDGRVETKTSFKKMTFNGTENWSAYTSRSNHFQITVGDNAFGSDSVVRIACNYLPGRAAYSNAGVDYGAFSADGSRLRFKNKDISTVDEWKAWLSELSSNGTPFTVVYKLANDVITDITATEAGQELLALKSNYPTTSVIADIDLNLTYRADTKNYIDNKIAERLYAIETAILNNI